ncbi:hypothetical protein HYS72_02730 [Candidatus Pacearchaeota archaeon]|nr:hypothetical protein [Candidatus Pacearchaeota archaeon]MBI2057341.1 hypothetical protein [Candidatus Pacearchaeota archaeon]
MKSEKSKLEKLKENYSKIQKKYGLPDFDKLNEEFRIEKTAETETDFLVREIRETIGETLENFLRFVEAILNPVNVPMFLFPIIKSLNTEEKNKLSEIYKKLSKLEIDAMKLIDYSEKKEAEFIKDSYSVWQKIKKDFPKIIEDVEKRMDIKSEKTEKGYFG